MAFTYNQTISDDTAGITLVDHYVLSPITVSAGSLLILCQKWEGTAAVSSITNDGGALNWNIEPPANNIGSNGEPHVQICWCIIDTARSPLTVTVNFNGVTAKFGRSRQIEYFTTNPASLDTDVPGNSNTTGPSAVSGLFSSATATFLVVGFCGSNEDENYTVTPPKINGHSTSIRGPGTGVGIDSVAFTNIESGPITDATVNATQTLSTRWTITGAAFKDASADPGPDAQDVMGQMAGM